MEPVLAVVSHAAMKSLGAADKPPATNPRLPKPKPAAAGKATSPEAESGPLRRPRYNSERVGDSGCRHQ